MTRDQLEARIWEITGRALSPAQVADLTAAAEAYAVLEHTTRVIEQEHQPLRHEHATDLYPLIALLAEALTHP